MFQGATTEEARVKAVTDLVKRYTTDDDVLRLVDGNEFLREHYNTSAIENYDSWFCQKDIINVGLMAGTVATATFLKYKKYKPEVEVFTGGTLEDHCQEQMDNMEGIGKKTKIFEILMCDWPEHYPKPKITIPFATTPKTEVVKYIPKELLPNIWTCRQPININQECGVCKSCMRRKALDLKEQNTIL
jgi:hypothetical protein